MCENCDWGLCEACVPHFVHAQEKLVGKTVETPYGLVATWSLHSLGDWPSSPQNCVSGQELDNFIGEINVNLCSHGRGKVKEERKYHVVPIFNRKLFSVSSRLRNCKWSIMIVLSSIILIFFGLAVKLKYGMCTIAKSQAKIRKRPFPDISRGARPIHNVSNSVYSIPNHGGSRYVPGVRTIVRVLMS